MAKPELRLSHLQEFVIAPSVLDIGHILYMKNDD